MIFKLLILKRGLNSFSYLILKNVNQVLVVVLLLNELNKTFSYLLNKYLACKFLNVKI
jgi:hypothetical protein